MSYYFLTPISCFAEQLVASTASKTLSSFGKRFQLSLILFLSRCDLLGKEIRNGVSVKKSLPSFGNRPNDAATMTKCEFRALRIWIEG
jgi:guanine nucleotide-binding protein subunit alpha